MALLAVGLFGGSATAQVSVTATAGDPGPTSYATLASAFAAINAGVPRGAVTVAITGDTTETTTAVLNASGSGAASYASVLVVPSGGAPRTISGAILAGNALISLNGADHVTIDGLNSGGNALTLANTTASPSAGTSTIRFVGGATQNLLTNVTILGSSMAAAGTESGNVVFGTDSVTGQGNDGNTVSHSRLGPAGANPPSKAVFCAGSTPLGNAAAGNHGVVVADNEVFDYFATAAASAGVYVGGGCSAWTITGNRFYQTAPRSWTTGASHRAIEVQNTTDSSGAQAFTITGNTVGFASAAGTGTYALSGSNGTFAGIYFNGLLGGSPSEISGNTVASVSLTGVTSGGTQGASPFAAILVARGAAVTSGNTVGSQSGNGSLSFSTTTTSATDVCGLCDLMTDDWTADANTVGSLSAANAAASGAFVVHGLRGWGAETRTLSAAANVVGGTAAGSIQNGSTSASAQVIGISSSLARARFVGNTVRNLTAAGGTGQDQAASVIGLAMAGNIAGDNLMSRNTVHALSNGHATAAVSVVGLYQAGGAGNLLERNFIHSLSTPSTSAGASVTGIALQDSAAGAVTTYRNNFIALGTELTANSPRIRGVDELGGTASAYFNSVYIGGSGVAAGAGTSYAIFSNTVNVPRTFLGNALHNARSNAGATGKHYALRTVSNVPGLTSDQNVLRASGAGGVTAQFGVTDQATLATWQATTGQDLNSSSLDPQFLAPAAATPDLHVDPAALTPVEGNGPALPGVADDFDGQSRAALTPSDIGADAGDFQGLDLLPPYIDYAPLPNAGSTGDRTLTASLADRTGVATGGLAPRVYYRKGAGAWSSRACTLASGSATSGSWDCPIVSADVGGLALGDVISYYLVAQDTGAPSRLASNPAGAVATDVNNVSSPPAAPRTYTIVPAFSGSYDVGAGQAYTSLTNSGGIFEALNTGALTGDVVVNLVSDLTGELGTHALAPWADDGAPRRLLIKPSGGPRTVSGSLNGALVRIDGADRVTIDGSTAATLGEGAAEPSGEAVGGDPALRQLTIQNLNTGSAAVVIAVQSGASGAQDVTLRNLVVTGQDPTTTLAGISLGGATPLTPGFDNDRNRVENCAVRKAHVGIYSAGQSEANPNTGTVITRNDLSATAGARLRRVGILVQNEDGVQVTENSVGGLATDENADAVGIGLGSASVDATAIASGGVSNALVARNLVAGVVNSGLSQRSAAGIGVAGSAAGANTLVNNMVSGVAAQSSGPDLSAGIFVVGAPGSATRLHHNSVWMSGDRGPAATQGPSYALAVTGGAPAVELRGNVLANTQFPGSGSPSGSSHAVGLAMAAFETFDSDYNDLRCGSPAPCGFLRTGGLTAFGGTTYATLAAWSAAVGGDSHSLSVDPLFVSANDLHLQAASPVVAKATPLAGLTVDFDGQPRSATAPDMGADELQPRPADLRVTNTDGTASATPGTSVTYTITATNLGPGDVASASVTDTFPGACLSVAWTCSAAGGGSCTAGGSGNINDTASLPAGASATYTALCGISPAATGTLGNTASVAGSASDPNAANNSATDTDTLVPACDASATITDGVTQATPGGSVTYTLVATNPGPSNSTGVVSSSLPFQCTSLNWTCAGAGGGSCSPSGSGDIFDNVTLPAGASVTYTIPCPISPDASGTLVGSGAVTAAHDTNGANDDASDSDTLVPSADLSITKTDGVTQAAPGGSVTYAITASNSGPSDTTASVADTFPAGCASVSWSCAGSGGGTCTASGSGNINDTSVSLPAGGAVAYTASCSIAPSASGTLSNTATVASSASDPDTGNNSATDTDTLTPSADLSITKTDGVGTATPGASTAYTITASNAGPSAVTGATVADTFPAVLTCNWSCAGVAGGTCAASGSGNINDTSVNLPVGGSVTYTATCSIAPSATGTLSNTATVSSSTSDPNSADNSATDSDTLTPSADLAVTNTDDLDPVGVHRNLTYTLSVANAGPSDAAGVTLTDTLPASTSFVSATPGSPTCTHAAGVVTCNLGALAAAGNTSVTVVATTNAPGNISNAASVSASTSDPTPGNNSASQSTTVKFVKGDFDNDLQTDLYIGKTATPDNRLWLMNGVTRLSELTFSPVAASASQQVSGVDDFNGDSWNDLVFWNNTTGAVEFWLMNGTSTTRPGAAVPISNAATLATNWKLSATADFNADGKPDIVWRNFTSQKIVIWTMNGTAKLGNIVPTPDQAVDANWEIVGAFDMNNDGATDFLWYNPNSGKIVYWWMNASVVRITGAFTVPANAGDNNWKVLAAGDYGLGAGGIAGTRDIVWRNATSGNYVVWYMNFAGARTAGTFTTPTSPSPNPTGWTIVGPR